jgi:hypothetical protein
MRVLILILLTIIIFTVMMIVLTVIVILLVLPIIILFVVVIVLQYSHLATSFHEDDAPAVGPYDLPAEVGVGANRFVYYATKSLTDEWERLPDLRPSDISRSREVQ